MAFKIVRNDITKMNTEAIVNTANTEVTIGAGCETAIYNAAGAEELLAYRRNNIGRVEQGEVFITPGFGLNAKYIIHAVSPCYNEEDPSVEEKLRSCYRKSLELAAGYQLTSIAFPLISTGSYGYPKEEAMRIAADEINAFLLKNDMTVYLVVFDTKSTLLGEKLYPDLEAYIDHNYVTNKRQEEYGNPYFNSVSPSSAAYNAYIEQADAVERRTRAKFNLPIGGVFSQKSKRSTRTENRYDNLAKPSLREQSCFFFDEDEAEPMAPSEEKISCPKNFDEVHESKLDERMKHLSDSFSQYLLYLIKDKNMENAEVWKRAIVDKKVFSKIKNSENYHPQKLTALCLCVGAKLNLDESKDLLARAGYALSPCDKTDIIFSYFIENEIYDMIELDIQLEEHGLPCIIQ